MTEYTLELHQAALLILTGLVAGFLNTVAGGGSLLTVPVMIFMGLPPAVANGTNRIAVVIQNIFATAGFRSKGISGWPYSFYLGLSALVGAIVGAQISVEISGALFNRILSIVMIAVVFYTIFSPFKGREFQAERLDAKHTVIGVIVFLFVGFYGGFIQAGVGFLFIAALSLINHINLVKINSIKVFVILMYTSVAIIVFALNDKLNWWWGLTLAVGNGTGGWIGSRWQVDKGEKWVRRILFVAVIGLAIKLWFYG